MIQFEQAPLSRESRAISCAGGLALMAIPGSAFIAHRWSLPNGFMPVDVILALLVVVGAPVLFRRGKSVLVFRQVGPGYWCLLGGGLVATLLAGAPSWGIVQLTRNILPILVLVIVTGVLAESRRARLLAVRLYLVTACVVAIGTFGGATGRSAGTFDNPNYAANFLVLGILLVFRSGTKRSIQGFLVVVFAAGCYRTGSFSVLPVIGTACIVLAWEHLRRFSRPIRFVSRLLMVAMLLVVGIAAFRVPIDSITSVDLGSGLNGQRLDRSSTTRFELWTVGFRIYGSNPLGVAPDGLAKRAALRAELPAGEMHNDLLDALVAEGPLGLLGELLIIMALWRFGRQSSYLHAVLAACITAGLFRQVWNFRHMWLVIAIVLADALAARGPARRTSKDRIEGPSGSVHAIAFTHEDATNRVPSPRS